MLDEAAKSEKAIRNRTAYDQKYDPDQIGDSHVYKRIAFLSSLRLHI